MPGLGFRSPDLAAREVVRLQAKVAGPAPVARCSGGGQEGQRHGSWRGRGW